MSEHLEPRRADRPSLLRRGVAVLVLIVAALLVGHFIVGLIMTVVWVLVAVIAVGAILWAANQLL